MPMAGRRCGPPTSSELLEPTREVTATDGRVELEIVLPMPAISRIDLIPHA